MSTILRVRSRTDLSNSHLREIRKAGYIPGVVYGRAIAGMPVEVDRSELTKLIRAQNKHALVTLSIDGVSTIEAMLHELQVDPLDRRITHVDFHQIRKGEKVNTVVPLQLTGTPEGVKEGGVIQQQLNELEIRCLPEKVPNSFEVPISHLQIGEQIRVSDLTLPADIEIRTSADELVLSIVPPKLDPVEEEKEPVQPEIVDERNGPGVDE